MRAPALVAPLVLAPLAAAEAGLVLVDAIVPGFFPAGGNVPGSALAGSVDAWGLRVEKGQRLDVRLAWSGDASLAVGVGHGAPCAEQLCLQRLVRADPAAPAACPEAEGSTISGAREVRLSWVAEVAGRVGLVVHPGLVREETPYALDVTVDGRAADASLEVDDSTVLAWPWVAACRV